MRQANDDQRVVLPDARETAGSAADTHLRVWPIEGRQERAAQLVVLVDLVIHAQRIPVHAAGVGHKLDRVVAVACRGGQWDKRGLQCLVYGVEPVLWNDVARERQTGEGIAEDGRG